MGIKHQKIKKMLICSSVTFLILTSVGIIAVWKSVIHIQLPHGAILHVMLGLRNNHANGAVVICPGGGYCYLSKWREGYLWFPYFFLQGYTPALLEYRLPRHNYLRPKTDGVEAIQIMRKFANEWHFNENNVGIVGFSAGGHLASTIMLIDNDIVRPNFGILFYPVISMKKELTHIGSHDQLLGKDASEKLERQLSNELHVTEKTPPVFIAVASDDKAVNPQNSILFHDEMRIKNRPASLYVYPSGGHCFVCRFRSEYRRQVLDDLSNWLSSMKLQEK